MPELFIPAKLRSMVNMVSVDMFDQNYYRIAARYNPGSDTIDVDPSIADSAVLCEELWHRRQRRTKEKLGLPQFEDRRAWIEVCADELGIAPRVRDVALRLNLDPDSHHSRYVYLLRIFRANCLAFYRQESLNYFQALRGEKLFDGLAFIIQKFYGHRFDFNDEFIRLAEDAQDPDQIDMFWQQVNKAKKCW